MQGEWASDEETFWAYSNTENLASQNPTKIAVNCELNLFSIFFEFGSQYLFPGWEWFPDGEVMFSKTQGSRPVKWGCFKTGIPQYRSYKGKWRKTLNEGISNFDTEPHEDFTNKTGHMNDIHSGNQTCRWTILQL